MADKTHEGGVEAGHCGWAEHVLDNKESVVLELLPLLRIHLTSWQDTGGCTPPPVHCQAGRRDTGSKMPYQIRTQGGAEKARRRIRSALVHAIERVREDALYLPCLPHQPGPDGPDKRNCTVAKFSVSIKN